MEQLLLHLRNLGFTEMESKIMVELATKGQASGYEVAKQLGVSRSNVYAALQRLTQQGYVRWWRRGAGTLQCTGPGRAGHDDIRPGAGLARLYGE